MTNTLMTFGMFVFSLNTAAYDSMQRSIAWRHPTTARVGARPARQFCGVDDESITLAGSIYLEISTDGIVSLEVLENMGNSGKKYLLIGGDGNIYGYYVIESLDTTGTLFFPDGTPRKIDFTLTLKRTDDDAGVAVGDLSTDSKVVTR